MKDVWLVKFLLSTVGHHSVPNGNHVDLENASSIATVMARLLHTFVGFLTEVFVAEAFRVLVLLVSLSYRLQGKLRSAKTQQLRVHLGNLLF